MSKITVTTLAGQTSGADANKVKIESGDDFNVVSGKVGIGTVNAPSNKNTVTPSLNVSGSGVNGAAQITRHTSVGGGGALLHLSGTRGSDVNSYTILQNNDGIGTVSFQGADGNEFVQGAAIQANVDGTPGDNDMPTRLGFFVTADGASTSTERMRIHNGGVVSFNNGIELGSGLDATAANVLDDYEEGTWTPVVKASSGGSTYTYSTHYEFRLPGINSSTNALPYTKIGNRVFITFSIWWNTSATTRYNISLPFAYSGSEYGITGTATPYSIAADQGLGILGTTANSPNFDTYTIASGGGHGAVPYTASSEVYYFINYQTA